MAYVSSELRLLVGGAMSNLSGPNIWSLDTTDPKATVDTNGYVSDATARGMRVGDIVIMRQWSSLATKTSLTESGFMAVASITSGAANLTDLVSLATNTD